MCSSRRGLRGWWGAGLGLLLVGLPAMGGGQTRGVFVSPTSGVAVGSVWGVFVGVSAYQQQDLNLKYADKDAEALHRFFTGQFKGRIPDDQFKLLVNGQATRGKILKEVGEVLRRAQPEDVVVLSLALHGLPDTSGQDLYFLAHDADANLPEDRGISRDDLLKQIARSKVRKIVLLLDACHAGGFGASSQLLAMRSANAADVNRMLVAMGQAQDGIAVLTASSAAERSQEGPQFCGGHGAFTCALLTGLKGAADSDGNGLVQMRELYDYTYRETKRTTTGYQNPEIQGRFDNGLPLAATGLGGKRPEGGASGLVPPGPDVDVSKYDQLEAHVKAAEKREQAWAKVRSFAAQPTVKRETRLAALEQFLADFADDNPHTGEVAALKQQLQQEVQVAKAPAYEGLRPLAPDLTGQDGAPMRLVPAGEFMMGSDDGKSDERPIHKVSLDAFYMDKYEVTNRLFGKFVKETGYKTTAEKEGKAWGCQDKTRCGEIDGAHWKKPEGGETVFVSNREEHPVVAVSWHDAQSYCTWAGKRLPTEAEFEYANRGGTRTTYWWGDDNPGSRRVANLADESAKREFPWLPKIMVGYEDGYVRTAPVGSFEPNPFGLHDTTGNVWEWTADLYGEGYYKTSPSRNPTGPTSDAYLHVIRGGAWVLGPEDARSAARSNGSSTSRYSMVGFRCVKNP